MSFIKYLRTTLLQNTCFFTEHSQKLEFLIHSDFRGSRSQMFKISALKNFAIFIKKHLCWGLLLIKLQAWRPATLLKTHMFSCEINFLRTAFSIEQLWWLLLWLLSEELYVMSWRNACFHQVAVMQQQLGCLFCKVKFSKCRLNDSHHVQKTW